MGDASDLYYEERERKQREQAPHAEHYQQVSPEPITVIEQWKLGFCLGNAVKYIARAEYKGSKVKDLEKAIWYLQREILHERAKHGK